MTAAIRFSACDRSCPIPLRNKSRITSPLEIRQSLNSLGKDIEPKSAPNWATRSTRLRELKPVDDYDKLLEPTLQRKRDIVACPRRQAGGGAVLLAEMYPPTIKRSWKLPEVLSRDAGGIPEPMFQGEERLTGALISLGLEEHPLVVFVYSGGTPPLSARGGYSQVADRLRKLNFEITQWSPVPQPGPMGQPAAPTPPPQPKPGQKAVWVVLPMALGNPMDPSAGTGNAQVVKLLEDKLNAGDSAMDMVGYTGPTMGEPSPLLDVLGQWGIGAQTDRMVMHEVVVAQKAPQVDTQLMADQWSSDLPITKALAGMRGIFAYLTPLQLDLKTAEKNGVQLWPLVQFTGEDMWAERNVDARKAGGITKDPATAGGPFIAAVAAAKHDTRLIVVGDQYWATDQITTYGTLGEGSAELTGALFPGNSELFVNSMYWLSGLDRLIAASARSQDIRRIKPMRRSSLIALELTLLGGMPLAAAAAGVVVWMIRRRLIVGFSDAWNLACLYDQHEHNKTNAMNFKTTATLLVLALLIGAYFFFVERNTPSTLDLEKVRLAGDPEEGTPLFTADELSTSSIDHLTIDLSGAPIEVARDGLDWYQVQPVHFALDSWSVQPVIDAAAGLRYSRKFIPGEDGKPKLDELGLAPPQATVTISAGGAKPAKFTIKVGKTGSGGRGYVMLDDKPDVYVVTDALHKAVIDQKPEDWRRHSLPSPHESRADRIAFTRVGTSAASASLAGQSAEPESFEMERHGKDWDLSGNDAGRIDPDKIKTLLDSLASLHIDKFVIDAPTDLAEYGLDKPALTLTIQSTPAPPSMLPGGQESPEPPETPTAPAAPDSTAPAGKPPASQPAVEKPIVQTLRIGGPVDMNGEAYFATWGDKGETGNVVFTILKSDRQRLDKSIKDFRDARLTALEVRDIREVTVERGKEKLQLERDNNGGWTFVGPGPGFQPDNDAVSQLLDSLTIVRADSFVPNAKPASDPIATVRLAAPDRPEPEVISIYPTSDAAAASIAAYDQYLVMRNHEPTGLLVPAVRLAKILAPAMTLRDRLVLDVKPAQIRTITIIRTGLPREDAVVTLTRAVLPAASQPATTPSTSESGLWQLTGGARIDDGFPWKPCWQPLSPCTLRPGPMRGEAAPSDVKSVINLEVAMTGGATQLVNIYPNSDLGAVPGINAFFRVDKAVVDALEAEFRDRTIVGIDVDDLKQVNLIEHPAGATAGRP